MVFALKPRPARPSSFESTSTRPAKSRSSVWRRKWSGFRRFLSVWERISLRGTSHTTTSSWAGRASKMHPTAAAPMSVLPPPVGTLAHTRGTPERSSW